MYVSSTEFVALNRIVTIYLPILRRTFNVVQPLSLATKLRKCFHGVVLLRTAKKRIRLWFARAISLFCLLTLLLWRRPT